MKQTLENALRLQKPNFRDWGIAYLDIFGTDFLQIYVYTPAHGKKGSFLVNLHRLSSWIQDEGENPFLDADCHNVLKIWRVGDQLHFYLYWVSVNGRNDVSGHMDVFSISVPMIVGLMLTHEPVRKLIYMGDEVPQSKLVFSASAHEQIRKISADPHAKRALIKLLKRGFFYRDTAEVRIFSDWGSDFYFTTVGDGCKLSGGICLSKGTVKEKYSRVTYSIHT